MLHSLEWRRLIARALLLNRQRMQCARCKLRFSQKFRFSQNPEFRAGVVVNNRVREFYCTVQATAAAILKDCKKQDAMERSFRRFEASERDYSCTVCTLYRDIIV